MASDMTEDVSRGFRWSRNDLIPPVTRLPAARDAPATPRDFRPQSSLMTSGSWPYLPEQCPACHYFQAESPPFVDDSGYEILGFCRHPRIGMELFRPQKLDLSNADRCPLFVRGAAGRLDND
jgi:hypothetical protein